jgi:PhnB protein
MASRLNPYLSFNGSARQAMEFYASVFGGNLAFNTFAEFGAEDSPGADRIMHGILETNAGYTTMANDVPRDMAKAPRPLHAGQVMNTAIATNWHVAAAHTKA